MQFEKGYLYHIYNQGNNRQKVFFNRENYLYFLRKIKTYICPFCDIIAWCLMPNHFHLMVLVKETETTVGVAPSDTDSFNYPQTCFNYIHQNPVKANLVKKEIVWEFSSARDYFDGRTGKLINKKIAEEYVEF